MSTFAPPQTRIVYPESDGKPMAENTLQYECIVALQGGLDELRPDDFVGADNFWYPVEGQPDICTAPDVYVALGRPKGHRGSYQQWNEGGVAPQVVFEVLSPGNRSDEMINKLRFYDQYGVEEYYIYDPDTNVWEGYRRSGAPLRAITDLGQWVSPRLGIRIDVRAPTMRVLRPDGQPFKTYLEQVAARKEAEALHLHAEAERLKAEAERLKEGIQRREAEARRQAAEARRQEAEAQRQEAEQRATAAEQAVEALKAKLRAAGIDPEA
jgi:Uma2 family endonuclease